MANNAAATPKSRGRNWPSRFWNHQASISGMAIFRISLGWMVTQDTPGYPVLKLTLAQVAPILPYLLLVLILIFRPKGLLGTRDD